MRDGFKRHAALWLAALFLIAGLLGGNAGVAFAAAWSGGTTEPTLNADGWYDINTPEDLAGMAAWVNAGTNADAKYRLNVDIDLGEREWTPIGTSKSFYGVFDGQNKKISGLKINSTDSTVGLFGYISGANTVEVKNLTIVAPNVSTTGTYRVGALAGSVSGSSTTATLNTGPVISQVGVEGGIIEGDQWVGGLIGVLQNGASLKTSYAVTSIVTKSTANGEVGGLVGYATSAASITSCYASSEINATSSRVGGLVGRSASTQQNTNGVSIIASYATGPIITASNNVGGLVGHSQSTGTINLAQSSYASGSVVGSSSVGGFLGFNNSSTTTTSAYDPQGTGQNSATGQNTAGTVSVKSLHTLSTAWQDGTDWVAGDFNTYFVGKPGYYPQIKEFADASAPDNVKAWSALSVVQLVTHGSTSTAAGESVMALSTPFALSTKDAADNDLTWRISGGAVLAVDDQNNLYVSPDKTGAEITLTASNGDDRWRTFALKTDDSTLTPLNGVTLSQVTTDITFGGIDPKTFDASNSAQNITVTYKDESGATNTIYVDIAKPNNGGTEEKSLGTGNTFDYVFADEGTYVLKLKIKDADGKDIYVLGSHTLVVTKGGDDPSDVEITKIAPDEIETSTSTQFVVSYDDNTGGDTFTLTAEVTTPSGALTFPMMDDENGKATFTTSFTEEGDYTVRVKVQKGTGTPYYADGELKLTVTKGDDPDPNPNDVKVTGISPTNPSASDEKQTFTVSYNDTSGVDDIKLTAVVTMLPNGEPQTFNMEKNQTVNNMGTATFEGIFDEPGTYSIQVWVEKGDEKYTAGDPVTITVKEPTNSDVTITGIKPDSLKASSTEATITVEFDDESGKEIKLFAEVTVNGTPWPDLLPLEMNDDGESATFTEIFNTPGVYTIRIKVQVGDDELYYANSYKTLTITKGDDPTPDPDPVDDPIEPDNDGHVDSTVIVRDSDGNQLDITRLAGTTSNGVELDKLYAMGLDCNIVDGKLHIFGDAEDIGTVTLDVYVRKSDGTETTTTVTVTINPVEHDDADTNQAVNNVAGDWTGSLTTETDSNGRRIYYFTIYVPLDLTDGNAVKVLEVGADGEACTITDENYVRDGARSTSRTSDTDNARAESTLNPRVEVKGWTRTYDDAEIVDV